MPWVSGQAPSARPRRPAGSLAGAGPATRLGTDIPQRAVPRADDAGTGHDRTLAKPRTSFHGPTLRELMRDASVTSPGCTGGRPPGCHGRGEQVRVMWRRDNVQLPE